MAETDCQSQGWLLDGFPRTAEQAKALEEAGIVADCFLFLNVPDEILVERVCGRRARCAHQFSRFLTRLTDFLLYFHLSICGKWATKILIKCNALYCIP